MPNDRRWCPRWSVRKGVLATVMQDGDSQVQGVPIDISRGGTYIASARLSPGRVTVRLEIEDANWKGQMPIQRKSTVLPERTGDAGGSALKFDLPLSAGEIALFATSGDAHGSLDLAREDYKIVNGEVGHIQGCRSQVFLAVLAAMSAWMITTIGIGVTNHLSSPLWIGIGVSCPYFLLTVAILATIEKANAINLRKGFLAALSDYLRADEAPPNYQGWAHLKINRSECRSRLEGALCPDPSNACWQTERERATRLTKHHHRISNIFDSFMAFVSLVYGVLYATATVLLLGLGYYYSFLYPKAWPIVVALDVVLGAFIAVVTLYLIAQVRYIRKGKKSIESFYLEWLAILRYCRSIQGVPIAAPQSSKAIKEKPGVVPSTQASSAPASEPVKT